MRRLKKLKEKAEWKRKEFREWSLKSAVRDYAAASCLLLTTRMHARLPRELRDMIYNHIWTPDYIRLHSTYLILNLHGPVREKDKGPHVMDARFMSDAVAPEVVEALYRMENMPIAPFQAHNPFQVERAVMGYNFRLSFDPAKHLRKLNVELDLDDLMWGPHEEYDYGKMEMDSIRSKIRTLLMVERKEGFKLSFRLKQRRVRLNDWPLWLDLLKPIMDAFENAGGQVVVAWTYDRGRVEHRVSRSLTSLVRKYGTSDWDPNWRNVWAAILDEDHRISDRHREYLDENQVGYVDDDYCSDADDPSDIRSHEGSMDDYLIMTERTGRDPFSEYPSST